jgi:hypothetical protein
MMLFLQEIPSQYKTLDLHFTFPFINIRRRKKPPYEDSFLEGAFKGTTSRGFRLILQRPWPAPLCSTGSIHSAILAPCSVGQFRWVRGFVVLGSCIILSPGARIPGLSVFCPVERMSLLPSLFPQCAKISSSPRKISRPRTECEST